MPRVAAACLLVVVGSCSAYGPATNAGAAAPSSTVPSATAARASPAAAATTTGSESAAPPNSDEAALPAGPSVAAEVLGWVVISDGAPIVRAAARIGATAPPGPGEEATAARSLVAGLLGVDPRATSALDPGRPAAIAVFRAATVAEGPPPLLAALPITGRAQLLASLALAGLPVELQPYGVLARTSRGPLSIGFVDRDRYALIAFRPALLGPAWAVLGPIVRRPGEAPLAVHVDLEHVRAAFGPALADLLGRFAASTEKGRDAQASWALRGARRAVRLSPGLRSLDVLVAPDDDGLTVTARAEGRVGGDFAGHIATQQTGPLWGLGLLPRDAVLVYATHRGEEAARDEADDATDLLAGDDDGAPRAASKSAERSELRDALGRAAARLRGDFVYAIWPGLSGGVGLGGAIRLDEQAGPAVARSATLEVWRRAARSLRAVVGHALRLDATRFPIAVRVLPGARRGRGVLVDEIRVAVRWPPGASGEQRRFESLFGKELVLDMAFCSGHAVFALGRDARERLDAMLAAATAAGADGHAAPSVLDDPRLREVIAEREGERVSLSYVPTQAMARFLGRLFTETHPDRRGEALDAVLVEAGDGAIVAGTTVVRDAAPATRESSTATTTGGRYELSTRVPAATLASLPRIGGLLWRMALSPLLNPPQIPPLPIPPAHVTPPAPEPSPRGEANAPTRKL